MCIFLHKTNRSSPEILNSSRKLGTSATSTEVLTFFFLLIKGKEDLMNKSNQSQINVIKIFCTTILPLNEILGKSPPRKKKSLIIHQTATHLTRPLAHKQ